MASATSQFRTEERVNKQDVQWMHGRVFYERTRLEGKYLIIPQGVDDPTEVIAAACTIFEMQLPRLQVILDGGHSPISTWRDGLMHKERWPDEDNFQNSIISIVQAVVKACTECNAWSFGFRGGEDKHGVDLFGDSRRAVKEAYDGLDLFCSVDSTVYGFDAFKQHAVPAGPAPEERAKARLPWPPSRFRYPHNPISNHETDGNKLLGECTHLILGEGKDREFMRTIFTGSRGLASLVPTVLFMIEGAPHMVSAILEYAQYMPVVVLQHTGGASDVISEAVLQRRESLRLGADIGKEKPVEYTFGEKFKHGGGSSVSLKLPANVKLDNFIILDASADSPERVVEKLIQCVSTSEDAETKQLGSKQGEIERIAHAWNMSWSFTKASQSHNRLAGFLQYTTMLVTLATTVASVLYSLAQDVGEGSEACSDDSGQCSVNALGMDLTPHMIKIVGFAVTVLPLVSAFLLSCTSKFSPVSKWAQLHVAAVRVRSEIYRYRSRTGEYSGFGTTHFDFEEALAEYPLLKSLAAKQRNPSNSSSGTRKRPGSANSKDSKSVASKNTSSSQVGSRRAIFSSFLDEMWSVLMQGEIKTASLPKATPASFHRDIEPYLAGRGAAAGATTTKRGDNYASLLEEAAHAKARDAPVDDGFGAITAEDYIAFRLRPTLERLEAEAPVFETLSNALNVTLFIGTGLNAVLSLTNNVQFMPLLTALISVIAAAGEYQNVSRRLVSVNASILSLQRLTVWWDSLSMIDKRLTETKEYLVETCESAIIAETAWISTLSGPKKQPKGASQKKSGKEGKDGDDEDLDEDKKQ
eukprot:TRINITY_DN3915_c0_g1_i3.p1 TRINITY_DN3915_c0_g1~~TRINITY_DN3915_c0_g1_i3.p1  ORF type:complete len:811 (+),score=106.48 TRINITY_DN3915_c0_g1_i3:58-2490(+)